jgi:hypothetical protein
MGGAVKRPWFPLPFVALRGKVRRNRLSWIVNSVFVKLLGVINYYHVNGAFLSFQFKADLLLQSSKQSRTRCIGLLAVELSAFGKIAGQLASVIHFKIVCAFEAGHVDHRAIKFLAEAEGKEIHAPVDALHFRLQIVPVQIDPCIARGTFPPGEFRAFFRNEKCVHLHIFLFAVILQVQAVNEHVDQHHVKLVRG